MLGAQRRALEEKRRQLTRPIEVIEMQNNIEHMKQYYSDEAWSELTRRREQMTPEMRDAAEQGTERWLALFRDIEAALGEDPASDTAQALVVRWNDLVESFTGGNAAIGDGVRNAWADRARWPASLQRASAPFADRRIWEFVEKARRAK